MLFGVVSGARCGRCQWRVFITLHNAWAKTRQVQL